MTCEALDAANASAVAVDCRVVGRSVDNRAEGAGCGCQSQQPFTRSRPGSFFAGLTDPAPASAADGVSDTVVRRRADVADRSAVVRVGLRVDALAVDGGVAVRRVADERAGVAARAEEDSVRRRAAGVGPARRRVGNAGAVGQNVARLATDCWECKAGRQPCIIFEKKKGE